MLRDHSQHSTPNIESDSGGLYTRKDVCRLLKIDSRQLKSWERQQLIPELDQYRFSDLLSLKTVARLRNENCRAREIRRALQALQVRLRDLSENRSDVRVFKDGRHLLVQIGRQKMEPASGQLVFDFEDHEISKLLHLPNAPKAPGDLAGKIRRKLEAERWFARGLELEQCGGPYEQIVEAYRLASELDPTSASAMVNLGTVYFNGHAWSDAEQHYKKALEIDPKYALAHFNLANLYDERGDSELALEHYREALKLNPAYADAHYNLALLYQGTRDVLGAVRHWRAFLRLDSSSSWAEIARRELEKLESFTVIQGSRGQKSKLSLVSDNV